MNPKDTSNKRVTPDYKSLELMIQEVAPIIKYQTIEVKETYHLNNRNIQTIYDNIELLLDCMLDVTGTPNTNHKLVAGQWCYLTNIYFETIIEQFNELYEKNNTEDTEFSIEYISRKDAYQMVIQLAQAYMKIGEKNEKGNTNKGLK